MFKLFGYFPPVKNSFFKGMASSFQSLRRFERHFHIPFANHIVGLFMIVIALRVGTIAFLMFSNASEMDFANALVNIDLPIANQKEKIPHYLEAVVTIQKDGKIRLDGGTYSLEEFDKALNLYFYSNDSYGGESYSSRTINMDESDFKNISIIADKNCTMEEVSAVYKILRKHGVEKAFHYVKKQGHENKQSITE